MTRLLVRLNSHVRVDAPISDTADVPALASAIHELETQCLAYNHRLVVVTIAGNVHRIIARA